MIKNKICQATDTKITKQLKIQKNKNKFCNCNCKHITRKINLLFFLSFLIEEVEKKGRKVYDRVVQYARGDRLI